MVFLLSSVVFFHLGRLRCECSFNRPSCLESVEKRRLSDSGDSRPFGHTESLSLKGQIGAGAAVLRLFADFPSALTVAEPVGSFVLSPIFRNYCESVEVSVCKINRTRHGSSRLGTVLTGPIGSSIPIGPLS